MDFIIMGKGGNPKKQPKQTRVQYHEKCNGLVLKSRLSSNIEVKMKLTLSRCLMPSYWKFAKLSRSDVQSILNLSPAKDVWLLGLALGIIHLSPSAFRTSYTTLNDIVIGSKVTAINNILAYFEQDFVENQPSVLDNSSLSVHHVPALPKFYIAKQEYDRLSTTLIPQLRFFSEPTIIHSIFHYRENTIWVAIQFEGECLYAAKLYPQDIVKKSGREKEKLLSTRLPILKYIKDKKVDDYNRNQYPVSKFSENNEDRNNDNNQPDEEILYCLVLDDGALFAFH